MEKQVRVSIVIVNWNGLKHLPECLDSLACQSFRDFEVIVVDNGSTDGSQAYLKGRPGLRLVELPENRGFAAGNNAALALSPGEYLVTLNNDTRVDEKWLQELVAVADRHPEAGMVGCRILSYQEPERVDSLGMAICPDGMSRGAFRGRRFSALALEKESEILFPSACAALYRWEMIEETGFFDEEFFAYCEDTDLGLRGRLAGWGALLARDAVVYHKYSMTSGAFSPFKLYLVERNHFFAAVKNFPTGQLWSIPWHTLLRYFTQAKVVIGAKGAGGEFMESASRGALVSAFVRGVRDAVLALPRLMRKRAAVMEKRRVSHRQMAELLRRHRLSFQELLDVDTEAKP